MKPTLMGPWSVVFAASRHPIAASAPSAASARTAGIPELPREAPELMVRLPSEPMDPVQVEDGRLSQIVDRRLKIDIGEELVARADLPECSRSDRQNGSQAGVSESRSGV